MGSKVIDVPNVGTVEFPDSMSDDQISTAIKGAYFPQNKGYTPQPEDATISSRLGGAQQWLGDLENDLRQGTTNTLPGRILHSMGARGIDVGSTPHAGDTLMSPILGPIHASQGIAETPEHPIAGPAKAIGGALETLTLPASFIAPEANMGTDLIPSKAYAGKVLGQVKNAIGDQPVNIQNVLDAAKRAQQFSDRGGGSVPQVIQKFLQKFGKNIYPYASDAKLPFEEARDFYSNATSKLTPEEAQSLRPQMLSHLAEFTKQLGGNIQQVADAAGYGQQFSGAMQEFRNASRLAGAAKEGAKRVGQAALAGAGLYGTGEIVRAIARGGR